MALLSPCYSFRLNPQEKFMRFSRPILLASALVFGLAPAVAVASSAAARATETQSGTAGSATGSATATPGPAAGGLSGYWELTITTPQDATNVNLTLQQDGNKLTGSLSGRMGTVPVTGTATDSGGLEVLAGIDVGGGRLAVNIDGKVEGDALTGTFSFGDMGQFPFTGKRGVAPAASSAAAPPAASSAAPAAPPAPADAASAATGAAGKWNVTLSIPGVGDLPASATFTQDAAGVVGGTLSSVAGDVAVSGTMTGSSLKLEFNASTPQGEIPVIMTGELTAAGFAGKATIVGLGEADWTATRVQ
jgi:hypothetical protein